MKAKGFKANEERLLEVNLTTDQVEFDLGHCKIILQQAVKIVFHEKKCAGDLLNKILKA